MSNPFLGEVKLVPYNFAPVGWAFCQGQLLSISQNSALFALLGTTYGGDGVNTFALPNLQGQLAISIGQNPSGSNYAWGQTSGVPSVTLMTNHLPVHPHTVNVSSVAGTQANPIGAYLALSTSALGNVYDPPPRGKTSGLPLQQAGGGQPHENRMPFLVLNYIIALEGIFPPQN